MFDNPFSMVVAIILIVTIGKVVQARHRARRDDAGTGFSPARNEGAAEAENRHLREELKAMKDRLAVLERIATENNDSGARLDREIGRASCRERV